MVIPGNAPQLVFFASVAFSVVAWSVTLRLYVWPTLRQRTRIDALRPILMLHTFRYIGLAFLVPGVVSTSLPAACARSAALGDGAAAGLALLALALSARRAGVIAAWAFNVWGTLDLLLAFFEGNRAGLRAGDLGAAYFLPTLAVPLLLTTHALAFRILARPADRANDVSPSDARLAAALTPGGAAL